MTYKEIYDLHIQLLHMYMRTMKSTKVHIRSNLIILRDSLL